MSAAKKAPVILIADPDPWSRDLLGQLVLGVRCDARLVLCGDGGEALAHCRRRRFALILAELNLPQVDGFELLREARLRRSVAEQPFILISDRADQASVRAAVALAPTAYLVKPFQAENLMQRLRGLLLKGDEVVACPLPERDAGENLEAFLERARDSAEGAPLLADVRAASDRCLSAEEHPLRVLEDEFGRDPQITAGLIAAANSAARHVGPACQTLGQALRRLGLGHSLNLVLGFSLQRAIQLGEPLLAERAMHFWDLSQRCADIAWELADALGADVERCYTAGLLHRLGDLALLRTLQDWCDGGGALDEARLDELLGRFGASFGS
ncbi:HDOD domain-containing protein, partial [Pseudomonas aeruginosa]|nr:HDOD domain-containing protein [Pseudomonas aeruginosa]